MWALVFALVITVKVEYGYKRIAVTSTEVSGFKTEADCEAAKTKLDSVLKGSNDSFRAVCFKK